MNYSRTLTLIPPLCLFSTHSMIIVQFVCIQLSDVHTVMEYYYFYYIQGATKPFTCVPIKRDYLLFKATSRQASSTHTEYTSSV